MARIANSLYTLRSQIDAAYPQRAKFNDGWIGDTAHQARKSDHNPNSHGVVQALDLSHDPAHGFDSYAFAELQRQKQDNRIKYVISNGRIFSSSVHAWEWRPYTGADSHSHHVHVSVSDDPAIYDDNRHWIIADHEFVKPDDPPLVDTGVTQAQRLDMAKHIVEFEARLDKDHHLMVYKLPANDGGGRYEVAGINEKYDGPEAAKLKALVEAKKFDEAMNEAELYILKNTDPATSWTTSAAVEFYLRDCVFNRGPHGAARILQHACGISQRWNDAEDDGQIGPKSRAAIAAHKPADMLTLLRTAREDYERHVVGYRANFWQGLVNRWDHALEIAKTYMEPEKPAAPVEPASPVMAEPAAVPAAEPEPPTPVEEKTA